MKLYYMKGACSLASYISLIEAGVKFEAVEVDHKTRRTRDGEDLNEINGKGYVPVLRRDNGQVLTENVAVLSYIGDLNPSARLAPAAGTFERYQLLEFLAYIASEIHKNFGPLFDPNSSQDVKRFVRGNLDKRLTWLNQAVGSKKTNPTSRVVSQLIEALSEGAPSRGIIPIWEEPSYRFSTRTGGESTPKVIVAGPLPF